MRVDVVAELPSLGPQDEVEVEVLEHAPPANERSEARRLALQALYEIDLARHPATEVIARFLIERQPSRQVARYFRKLVEGVLAHVAEIDASVVRFAPDFPLEQIAIVDRNVLRIAVYEFAVSQRVPISVAINEAVELAKLFGSDGAPGFVNGVLGALADHAETVNQLRQDVGEDRSL
ncbi:MAG: transcription antitermination factor NusB [Anaerolineae bacterium]|nr:transcription antitermination factor NusB [Anaerolineae bacterium]